MRVGILHYGKPQWTEREMVKFFDKKQIETKLFTPEEMEEIDLCSFSFVLNRIYASTANQNEFDFHHFYQKLKAAEEKGARIINSSFSALCDYDKFFASQVMFERGVLNPRTKKVSSKQEVIDFLHDEEGPVIFKPNTGGRGVGIYKIDNDEEVPEGLFSQDQTKSEEFIIQSLARSVEEKDYRIFLCDEQVLFANTRTLIDGWMGSRSLGSKVEVIHELPKGLLEVAIKATRSIGAIMNSLDIVRTKEGFSIIENNPTPNFNESYVELFGFNPVEKIVEKLIEKYGVVEHEQVIRTSQ